MPRLLKRLFAPEAWFFVAIWTGLLVVGRSRMLRDPGVFWHTATGLRILATHHVPHTDPFSATCAGQPWFAMEWLSECVMALVYRAASFDGLLLLGVTVIAAIYAVLARRLLAAGCHPILACALLALAFAASANHIIVRPLLASHALLTWMFAMLVDVDEGRKNLRSLAWLVPVVLVWTNLHGAVLAGIGTVGLTLGMWTLFYALRFHTPLASRRLVAAGALLFGAVVLVTIVNPFGASLPAFWVRYVSTNSSWLSQVIAEHRPLSSSPGAAMGVGGLGVIYGALLVGTSWRELRATWVVPIAIFALAWSQVTYAPYFAISATLVVPEILPQCRWLARLTRGRPSLFAIRPPKAEPTLGVKPWAGPVVVVAIAALLESAAVPVPLVGSGWARLHPSTAPLDLRGPIARVSAAAPDGTGIFNDMDYGGFLILFAPRLRVFIDDREFYGETFETDYTNAARDDPERVDAYAERYGLRFALVRAGSSFDRYIARSAEWRTLAAGETANLYERL